MNSSTSMPLQQHNQDCAEICAITASVPGKAEDDLVDPLVIADVTDCNLYIKNIDYDISDEHLYKVFSAIGEITSHHIVRDANMRSRGFGFLSYKSSESARRAIAELNGKFIGKKPIVVMLHIRKEQRKQLKKLIPESLMIADDPHSSSGVHNSSTSPGSQFYSPAAQNAVLPLPPNSGKKHINAYYNKQDPIATDVSTPSQRATGEGDTTGPSDDSQDILKLDANALLLQQWEQQKKHQLDHHLRHQQQLSKQQTLLQQKHQQQMQRLQRKHLQMQHQPFPSRDVINPSCGMTNVMRSEMDDQLNHNPHSNVYLQRQSGYSSSPILSGSSPGPCSSQQMPGQYYTQTSRQSAPGQITVTRYYCGPGPEDFIENPNLLTPSTGGNGYDTPYSLGYGQMDPHTLHARLSAELSSHQGMTSSAIPSRRASGSAFHPQLMTSGSIGSTQTSIYGSSNPPSRRSSNSSVSTVTSFMDYPEDMHGFIGGSGHRSMQSSRRSSGTGTAMAGLNAQHLLQLQARMHLMQDPSHDGPMDPDAPWLTPDGRPPQMAAGPYPQYPRPQDMKQPHHMLRSQPVHANMGRRHSHSGMVLETVLEEAMPMQDQVPLPRRSYGDVTLSTPPVSLPVPPAPRPPPPGQITQHHNPSRHTPVPPLQIPVSVGSNGLQFSNQVSYGSSHQKFHGNHTAEDHSPLQPTKQNLAAQPAMQYGNFDEISFSSHNTSQCSSNSGSASASRRQSFSMNTLQGEAQAALSSAASLEVAQMQSHLAQLDNDDFESTHAALLSLGEKDARNSQATFMGNTEEVPRLSGQYSNSQGPSGLSRGSQGLNSSSNSTKISDKPSCSEASSSLIPPPGFGFSSSAEASPLTRCRESVANADSNDMMNAASAYFSPKEAESKLDYVTFALADPSTQRQLLANRLFPLIREKKPFLAQPITDFLLENADASELLQVLDDPALLLPHYIAQALNNMRPR